jgi:hypothetical protein
MKIKEKYVEALKQIDDWVKVSDWAIKVGEVYPDLLEKAEQDAAGQALETTGLRELAARISSNISSGSFNNQIEIDSSESPRLVRHIVPEEQAAHEKEELEDDIAPLKRSEIIKKAEAQFTTEEKYRVNEFETISAQLKSCFGLTFEVDHAKALLNDVDQGPHHPANLQLLLKSHNGKKSNHNWDRFTVEEQIEYIDAAVKLQSIIASRLRVDMVNSVLESLKSRIKTVF